jgi:hypothetical protein
VTAKIWLRIAVAAMAAVMLFAAYASVRFWLGDFSFQARHAVLAHKLGMEADNERRSLNYSLPHTVPGHACSFCPGTEAHAVPGHSCPFCPGAIYRENPSKIEHLREHMKELERSFRYHRRLAGPAYFKTQGEIFL